MKQSMRALKEIETPSTTPEQLLQILDGELATRRSHRAATGRNRAIILVVGILLIVGCAGAALLILDQMVSDLRQNAGKPPTEETPSSTNN